MGIWLLASGRWSGSSFGPSLAWGCPFPRLTPFSVRRRKKKKQRTWISLTRPVKICFVCLFVLIFSFCLCSSKFDQGTFFGGLGEVEKLPSPRQKFSALEGNTFFLE